MKNLRTVAFTIIVIGIAAFILGALFASASRLHAALYPIRDVFTVNMLFIPDHHIGGDPIVVYAVRKERGITVEWRLSTLQVFNDGAYEVCFHDGKTLPGTAIPEVKLSNIIGPNCKLNTGDYYVRGEWTVVRMGIFKQSLKFNSNRFTVTVGK